MACAGVEPESGFAPAQPIRARSAPPGKAADQHIHHVHIESLSPAAGSEFAVLKPDNATGNFVKVAQRIAIRIRIDPNQQLAERLRPGMSVIARIRTADQ